MKRFAFCGTAMALCLGTSATASVVGVFHENLQPGDNTLFVFGGENTTGTISSNDGVSTPFTIDSTGVFVNDFGSRGREMTRNGEVNQLSFRVDSADPVSALALNRGSQSTDMTTLLDEDALGSRYRVLSSPGVFGDGSQFSVTAIEDDTDVTITSPIGLVGNAAETPFTVTLQAGESVFYESGGGNDVTGTQVSANRNVAVFAGSECTQVPVGTVACDHLISQQFSTENFDTAFRVVQSESSGTDGDLIRIVGDTDQTEVFLDGVSQGVIDAGEVLEIDMVGNAELTASAPVTVGQFLRGQGGTRSLGDPAFAILPSVDQELNSYAYATPVGRDAFDQNFLSIAIDEAIVASLTLNGNQVDTSAFEMLNGILFGTLDIPVGFGTVEASDAFLATIQGFSNFDSYFSPIATAFSPGVSPPPDDMPTMPPVIAPIPLPAGMPLLFAALGAFGVVTRRARSST